MNEQKKVHITIFQAPFASLIDLGLYMKMHDPKQPFQATVPAEYYLAVFDGEIEPPHLSLAKPAHTVQVHSG